MNIDMCVTSDYPYMAAVAARVASNHPLAATDTPSLAKLNFKGTILQRNQTIVAYTIFTREDMWE